MNKSNNISFIVGPALALLVASTMSLGCAKPQAMTASSNVPAGEGTVETDVDDNGNTTVLVRVSHLGQPSNVESGSTIYVVWIQARGGANQNVGALNVSDDLEGSLEMMTPHRRFTLSVTQEPNGHVSSPTHDPVFTAMVEASE